MATLEQIKELRDETGAGIVDVKKALEEANDDKVKAVELLRKRGGDKAIKKSERVALEGIVGTYVHGNKKIAAMVSVMCETDFVARNEDFVVFATDVAMHITASNPTCIFPEDVDSDIIESEKKIWTEQLSKEGKSVEMIEKILIGKEKKFREEQALMTQSFVKNPDITVMELLNEVMIKLGEKIEFKEFKRFAL